MRTITPFLWFDREAEAAANFYVSIFKNSKITALTRYDESSAQVSGQAPGSVMTVAFELDGQEFVALNGGPQFKFTEAVSFVVNCTTQEEVDYYWEKLTAGEHAQVQQCGWVKDKYGLSWQIVPSMLSALLHDANPQQSASVMQALLQMQKLDIETLKEAYARA